MRSFFCTASTIATPSAKVCDSGFSQKMSFLARAASTAVMACQWSGVEMHTASMSRAAEQLAEVLVALAVLVLVVLVDALDGLLEMALVHVGDGHHPAVLLAEEGVQVAFALPADADAAHDDLLGRGVVAEQTRPG